MSVPSPFEKDAAPTEKNEKIENSTPDMKNNNPTEKWEPATESNINNNQVEEDNSKIRELLPGKVVALRNIWSKDLCQKQIQRTESLQSGYSPATIGVKTEEKPSTKSENLVQDARNNDRVVVRDEDIAQELWKKVCENLPEDFLTQDEHQARGLDSNFRFYRYAPGQKFARHYDGYEYGSVVYATQMNEAPKLSFLLYLNEDFEGGKTTFFNSQNKEILSVTPETGMCIVYSQKLLHEGSVVTKGTKYALRSDIFFKAFDPNEKKKDDNTCILV